MFFSVEDLCCIDNLEDFVNVEQCIVNCVVLGVFVDFNFDYDLVMLEGVNGGNIDFQVEQFIFKILGLVYIFVWFEGFIVIVDYWEIEFIDVIINIDG